MFRLGVTLIFSSTLAFVDIDRCFAEGENASLDQNNVVIQFESLEKQYVSALSKSDLESAKHYAEKLLEMDPADTVAYLRLAIAIGLNQNMIVSKEYADDYKVEASEGTPDDIRLKAIANALFEAAMNRKQ